MKHAYFKPPGAKRRRYVEVIDEYDNPPCVKVRLATGQEWTVFKDEVKPSRMEERRQERQAFRDKVAEALVKKMREAGMRYEEARSIVGASFGLSAKSVGRLFRSWQEDNGDA